MTRALASHNPGTARPSRRLPARPGHVRRFAGAAVRMAARRPGTVLGLVAILGGGGAFAWNALLRQPTPHPAPLFAAAKPVAAPAEPPRRPDFQAASVTLPARPDGATSPARTNATDPASRQQDRPGDSIGALIRAGEPGARTPDPKASTSRIASVQKALVKLGYGPMETDGVFGSITRQAIERFERDRNLPVTGGLGTRTTRQLAARSGLQVE